MSDDKDAAVETTDKPEVKLRLHERVVAKLSASMGFCVFCAVLLVSLIALGIIGNYWDEGWKSDQWGPVAAWFGGMLTAGAVTLSLYQSRTARKEADRNREDADRRHTEQIDERHVMRQVDSLAPLWSALNELTVPATRYAAALEVLQAHKKGYIPPKVAEAKKLVEREYMNLAPYLSAMEMSFSESLIVMDEPHLLPVVEKLYVDYQTYQKATDTFMSLVNTNKVFDVKELRQLKGIVSQTRNTIIHTARAHLTKVRPLSFDFTDPQA